MVPEKKLTSTEARVTTDKNQTKPPFPSTFPLPRHRQNAHLTPKNSTRKVPVSSKSKAGVAESVSREPPAHSTAAAHEFAD